MEHGPELLITQAERLLTEQAIDRKLPESTMDPRAALWIVRSETLLDGDPSKNLATFVTTFMGPEARQVIDDNLHRNYIDHAEYPRTAEISKRCVRMLHDLFHGEGEPDEPGAACAGSSEAVMLGALAMKWRWRKAREKAGKSTEKPNLVYGADVHVVWDKFCRYFDVEPRQIPLAKGKTTITPTRCGPRSTRTRSARSPSSARPSPASATTSPGSTRCSRSCAARASRCRSNRSCLQSGH